MYTIDLYFIVGNAPALSSDMEDVTVIAPEDGVLECHMTRGDPKADIKWFKENKQIYAGKKIEMKYENNKGIYSPTVLL